MIIKKIILENFLCYYGLKEFELSKGLNIILGENGEGKTKFFEALEWLFTGNDRNLDLLISAKALANADVNEQFRVRVAMNVEQYDEKKTIAKSFIVKKLGVSYCTTSNYSVEGIEENKVGERSQFDGINLLERVFPSKIRKYSMFKGEAQLDIFKNDDALMNLINSFSSAKYYEIYSEKGEYLRERAEKAVEEATRNNSKSLRDYKCLEDEISILNGDKNGATIIINSIEDEIRKTEEFIQEAEKYVTNAEALNTINGRINHIKEQMSKISSCIDEDYTTALFDKNCILVNFEKIHNEFSMKITALSNKKRELQTDYEKQIGIKKGKDLMRAQLLNNSIPLPTGVPSKAHMEEMLKDELCKVCNRPAKKGSSAYNFMLKRLEEYLTSQIPEESNDIEDQVLFKNDYISRLFNLAVSHEDNLSKLRSVKRTIRDLFDFNKKRREELESLQQKLNIEISEREKVIGSSSLGAEKLGSVLKNYNGWQRDLTNKNKELTDYKKQLKEIDEKLKQKKTEKDAIDTQNVNTFLLKTREVLRDIEEIFNSTKQKKFDEFIQILQKKSNSIFERINIEAFTGTIVFNKKTIAGKDIVKIELQESDGRIFHLPNQSLLTSMHISILLAISELAAEYSEESYPMIFDAPTSSFGETKTSQFLNLIYENTNQKILLIKDFLVLNEKTNKLEIKKEFSGVKRNKAFWICLERPFNKKNLSTLNTQVIVL
ncbi:MAG: AAA family ATPase [Prolixibacteraceae bacterium]|nr:AAA family ATPase [Prolixibacteraceae bacterium]